ncbi:MAG: Sulfite oxidase [Frankiales bacterium]|nr:Sulfite oxidase [Frankiales bacterium]
MTEVQPTGSLLRRSARREAADPTTPGRSPAMGARRLVVRSLCPLNAETPPEELGRAELTPSELFFVRTHGAIPRVDVGAFRLSVDGDVRSPLTLSLPELRARFTRATVTATLVCAGNRRNELRPLPAGIPWGPGAIGTATWSGVRLRDVLLAGGLSSRAQHVAFTGLDDTGGERFAGSIPIAKALAAEVLLADMMNGAPLPREHGFPLRAVVPGYIGARSVKWLTAISVTPEASASAFQRQDYVLHGTPLGELQVTSAICRPASGTVVETGLRAEGYAAGTGGCPVTRVEVSADAGRTWSPATLHGWPPPWTWRLWHADLQLRPGAHELVVRATDSSGATQLVEMDPTGNPHGYLNNAWHRITVVAVPEPAAGGRAR